MASYWRRWRSFINGFAMLCVYRSIDVLTSACNGRDVEEDLAGLICSVGCEQGFTGASREELALQIRRLHQRAREIESPITASRVERS
jgi:hypothetical protein